MRKFPDLKNTLMNTEGKLELENQYLETSKTNESSNGC